MMNIAASPQIVPGFGITEITSDPNGAEIFLDGKFVGTCPATLHISEGAHEQVLKSARHTDWSRSISILKDSTVTVKATLAPI
jgi:PEGA domain